MVVDIAGIFRHDNLVLEPLQVGQALHPFGIRASNACSRGVGNCSRTPRGDNSPFRFGDLRQALANSFHQFVHLHVVPGSLIHSLLHLRKALRAGDDGEGALAIYDRADADGFVDTRTNIKIVRACFRRKHLVRNRLSRYYAGQREQAAGLEQIAPCERALQNSSCDMFSLLDSRLHELPSANWSRQDPCDSANGPKMSEEAAVPPPLRTGVVRGYLFFFGEPRKQISVQTGRPGCPRRLIESGRMSLQSSRSDWPAAAD